MVVRTGSGSVDFHWQKPLHVCIATATVAIAGGERGRQAISSCRLDRKGIRAGPVIAGFAERLFPAAVCSPDPEHDAGPGNYDERDGHDGRYYNHLTRHTGAASGFSVEV
jgi:hypothetical protein